jgi:hypothetical protein
MGSSEEAQEEGGSIGESCCSIEALLTFKVAKKFMINMRP